MSFVSPEFLFVFLPLTLMAYHASYHVTPRGGFYVLLCASAVFYGLYSWFYLLVLLALSWLNYLGAKHLLSQRDSRIHIPIITLNLAWLGYIKYATFFTSELLSLGINTVVIETGFVLAISFYTFQNIAFIVDAKKGLFQQLNLTQYWMFVLNFAQLISGPLVRYQYTAHQYHKLFQGKVPIAWRVALAYIAIGLVKKLLIADTLAPHVDVLFDLSQHDSVTAWHSVYAMLMYGLYIYFDFSGFCDIALGLGLLFGVRLPKNFISPYQARNIRQFWRTWHITLSQFFSTYIYQPLGGNRHGLVLTLSLVLLVFGLSGLWHGANYTFIVWGACHGLMLCVLITYEKLALPALPRLLGRSVTLLGVFLAWVYFRADSLEDAHILLNGLANLQSYTLANLIALQVNTGMAVLHFGLACAVLLWWVLTAPCSHVWTRYIARASAQGTSMTVSILTHPYLVGIAVFTLFKLTAFSPAPDFIYVNF